ncbi:hypothetical protein [Saccharopolyspora taberi]|uniref:Uncharacterized protein n=1 Tax=Saccharopolyspora taberi TaxID=60895 RepID=A0ABN3VFM1_9PSEU
MITVWLALFAETAVLLGIAAALARWSSRRSHGGADSKSAAGEP